MGDVDGYYKRHFDRAGEQRAVGREPRIGEAAAAQ